MRFCSAEILGTNSTTNKFRTRTFLDDVSTFASPRIFLLSHHPSRRIFLECDESPRIFLLMTHHTILYIGIVILYYYTVGRFELCARQFESEQKVACGE